MQLRSIETEGGKSGAAWDFFFKFLVQTCRIPLLQQRLNPHATNHVHKTTATGIKKDVDLSFPIGQICRNSSHEKNRTNAVGVDSSQMSCGRVNMPAKKPAKKPAAKPATKKAPNKKTAGKKK